MKKTIYPIAAMALSFLLLAACTGSTNYVSISDCGTTSTFSKGSNLKVAYSGEIEVADDDQSVKSISKKGFLKITKGNIFNRKRVVIKHGSDGQMEIRYFEGLGSTDFEPDGREWLAEVLPEVLRSTTIAMEQRVDRMYSEGGAAAVMGEIQILKNESAQSAYLESLLQKPLEDEDVVLALNFAADEISSSYHLSELLKGQKHFLKGSAEVSAAFVSAANKISSDYYAYELITESVDPDEMEAEDNLQLLAVAGDISSDYYLSEVLVEILQSRKLNSDGILEVISLTSEMSSDYYATEVFKAISEDYQLSARVMQLCATAMENIASDYYMAEVVEEMLSEKPDDTNAAILLNTAAKHIASDHYLYGVLTKALKHPLGSKSYEAFLVALGEIQSQHYQDEVVEKLSARHTFTGDQLDRLHQVVPHHQMEVRSL